jgi:hypothetical protein
MRPQHSRLNRSVCSFFAIKEACAPLFEMKQVMQHLNSCSMPDTFGGKGAMRSFEGKK